MFGIEFDLLIEVWKLIFYKHDVKKKKFISYALKFTCINRKVPITQLQFE